MAGAGRDFDGFEAAIAGDHERYPAGTLLPLRLRRARIALVPRAPHQGGVGRERIRAGVVPDAGAVALPAAAARSLAVAAVGSGASSGSRGTVTGVGRSGCGPCRLSRCRGRHHHVRWPSARCGHRRPRRRCHLRLRRRHVTRGHRRRRRGGLGSNGRCSELRLYPTLLRERGRAGADDLAHDIPRDPQLTADRLDRRAPYEIRATDPRDRLHDQHPELGSRDGGSTLEPRAEAGPIGRRLPRHGVPIPRRSTSAAMSTRTRPAWPASRCGLRPPIDPAVSVPRFRHRCISFTTKLTLTSYCAATTCPSRRHASPAHADRSNTLSAAFAGLLLQP